MTLITQKGEKYGDAVLVINSRVHLSNAPVWKKKKKKKSGDISVFSPDSCWIYGGVVFFPLFLLYGNTLWLYHIIYDTLT